MSRHHPRLALTCVTALTAAVLLLGPAPTASSAPAWAPAATATIHPGVQMVTGSSQCTANFVFYNATNDVYLGYAAHCAGTGAATETNGCDAGSLPLGTLVTIQGASKPGRLVYSSWLTMQAGARPSVDACENNDFALVKIDLADKAKVNPSIPHWGGPNGINPSSTALGSRVYSYGNSNLRLGLTQLSPKTGVSLGTTAGGWTHPVYAVSPGIPGDSGAAMLDASGRAAGVLSTVALTPLPASNNFSDLAKVLSYARSKFMSSLTLANGTVGFATNKAPLSLQ